MDDLLCQEFCKFLGTKGITAYDPEIVQLCLQGITDPVDSKKWPKSWRKTPKRLLNVLEEVESLYLRVLQVTVVIPFECIDSWNALAGLPSSKRMRVVGSAVPLVKVYPKSRFFWDMLVLDYLRGPVPVEFVVKRSIAGKLNLTKVYPKWVIRDLQRQGVAKAVSKRRESRLTITEEGDA